MKTNVGVLAIVVVLAIIEGSGITTYLVKTEINAKIVKQQTEILTLLKGKDASGESSVMADLQKKVANIETKVDGIAKVFAQVQKQGQAQNPQRPQEDFTTVHKIPVGDSAVNGKANAPVIITGFLDLQCPFSARFEPVIDEVLKAYPGKVSYMVKHFPLNFHKEAIPAAKAVLAAGEQKKYYEMLEAILKDNRGLTDDKLEKTAKGLRLNIKKFKQALANKKWDQIIAQDTKLGTEVGVRGTPTYYINGRKTKARTLEAFKAEIDAILNKK